MKETSDIISVIMGIYNCNDKEHLRLALDSIFLQTYDKVEYILCNDGSTDDTFQYIKEIYGHDPRVILIENKENMGLAASLNHCITYASGEYIARMDIDDISAENRFEVQMDFLKQNPTYDFVGSNINLINDKGIWGERKMPEFPSREDFLFGSPFVHPSILFRSKSLRQVNGYRVSKETRRMEDYDLFMRMYACGYKGANIQENLLSYREDSNAYRKRKYRYRIDEAKVRYKNYKILGLIPIGYVYVMKPLIVGLVPYTIINILRKKRNR